MQSPALGPQVAFLEAADPAANRQGVSQIQASRSAYPQGGTPSISLIPPPKALVVVDAGLGTIIDDKVMFWHNGGNVGFRSLYVGDPVSGNGMAAMTNGHKGEEVCNALRQRGLFQS